jgi:flagellar motor component MotA
MERHSELLQEMAAKERSARDKHEQLVALASQAEKARQDAVAALNQQTSAIRQAFTVSDSQLYCCFNDTDTQIDRIEFCEVRVQLNF